MTQYFYLRIRNRIWYNLQKYRRSEILEKSKNTKLITMFLLLVALMMSGCYFYKNSDAATFSTMKVHYIDVGQSDSVLIESNKHYMLIDAGDIDAQDTIVDYLNAKKIKKLDYFILTHPHADYIGSAEDIIYNFGIEKLIMPPKEHTTKTFEIVLDAIEEKGLKISELLKAISPKYVVISCGKITHMDILIKMS